MDLPQEVSTPPTIFRSSWVRWVEILVLGLIGIAVGWWLLVTNTPTNPPLTPPIFAAIVPGALSLFIGVDHFIRPSPDVAVDDQGVTLSAFGRIPWAGISRIHLVTFHTMRFLAIELVEPRPKLTGSRWPRWVYGPIGKLWAGYPLAISERWLRPISLDDIAAELHRRNPGLVIARSERSGFRWW
ncbi:hypothetical protein KO481_37590 [Nocardia sp. NEAU-G5]|uniref:PH domain-containing protein n=1 Tax=Nocardia albiluteola TaxID=2842303 RepID=A0ABS6BA96_9NOCA|nr:hypothetical protein [Nocardia albiluteola]MBU3067221.1 hypothetical protein [Nocardia albiluteola]